VTTVVKRETRLWPELYDMFEGLPLFFGRGPDTELTMRVEEFIDDGTCVLRAEIPGVNPDEDIDVSVDDRMISISAQRTESHIEGKRSEFRYGKFARHLTLPQGALPDRIKATYERGVLEVRIPLEEESRPSTHVPITVKR